MFHRHTGTTNQSTGRHNEDVNHSGNIKRNARDTYFFTLQPAVQSRVNFNAIFCVISVSI
jgi:hypothetical protein